MTADPSARRQARRGLAYYFVVLAVLTIVAEGMMLRSGQPIAELTRWVYFLMYTPAIASFVARAALREGPHDVSFAFGGRAGLRACAIGFAAPLVVGGIAYGIGWASGLAPFAVPATGGAEHGPPALQFASRLGVLATLGTTIGAVSAMGEEIGWRGYMLTRLIDAGVPRPILVSGVIWGLWHLPLILSGQYAAGPHPNLSAVLFMADIIAAGYLAAYLRLSSGSVWPSVLFHAAWNAIIQGVFDHFTPTKTIWLGESGLLVAIVALALVGVLLRGRWPVRRVPGGPVEEIDGLRDG